MSKNNNSFVLFETRSFNDTPPAFVFRMPTLVDGWEWKPESGLTLYSMAIFGRVVNQHWCRLVSILTFSTSTALLLNSIVSCFRLKFKKPIKYVENSTRNIDRVILLACGLNASTQIPRARCCLTLGPQPFRRFWTNNCNLRCNWNLDQFKASATSCFTILI